MKKIILFFAAIAVLASCTKDRIAPNAGVSQSGSQLTLVKTSYGIYCPSEELQYWESHKEEWLQSRKNPQANSTVYQVQRCTLESGYTGCECGQGTYSGCSGLVNCRVGSC